MNPTIFNIIILISFWYTGMGWFWLAKRYAHVTYSAIAIPVVYALFCTGIILSQPAILVYLGHTDYAGLTFLSCLIVHICALAIYVILNPQHGLRGGKQTLLGQIRYWISKCTELLFQQLVLSGLALLLVSVFGNRYASLDEFVVIFFLIHLPLLGILPRYWALYFIVASLVGGFLFGSLHILFPDGLWVALAMHQVFYIITTVMTERGMLHKNSDVNPVTG